MTERLLACLAALAASAALALCGPAAHAQKRYDPGASDTEIRIGQTLPYSGPASAYGTIGKVQAAYFRMVNDQGGINGRRITLISLDDGYSPPRTVEMVRRLVEQDQVLALFQTLGTPSNTAIHQYVNAKKVPHLFLSTGASKWNDPRRFPWTMAFNVSYRTEGHAYGRHIALTRPAARIGVLYQNDDYGKDYLAGFKEGLGERARQIVAELPYEVGDATVDAQVVQLKRAGADTFFNVATPRFATQAIRKAAELGWQPVHYLNNVSASIGAVLVPAGLDKCEGLISMGYYMDPLDREWDNHPAMKEWVAFMKKYYPEGSLLDGTNVYGYAAAQTMVQVLRQAGDELTRENVMRQAASLKDFVPSVMLPGIRLSTSPTDFAPIESLQLARFNGKQWERFGEVITRAR